MKRWELYQVSILISDPVSYTHTHAYAVQVLVSEILKHKVRISMLIIKTTKKNHINCDS